MGLGVYVKCKKCNTRYDLSIGYGGINDYHEFVCFSCKSIFCKSVEHQDVDFHSIGVEVFSKEAVQIEDNIFNSYFRNKTVKCSKCASSNVKEILLEDIFCRYPIINILGRTKLVCPRCQRKMHFDGEFYFDD